MLYIYLLNDNVQHLQVIRVTMRSAPPGAAHGLLSLALFEQ